VVAGLLLGFAMSNPGGENPVKRAVALAPLGDGTFQSGHCGAAAEPHERSQVEYSPREMTESY